MSGKADKIAGRLKQAAGDLTDDDDLKNEGDRQEVAGKTKDAIDQLSQKVEDAVDKAQDKLD